MAEGHRLKDQKDDCECLDALPYMVILRGARLGCRESRQVSFLSLCTCVAEIFSV